jgi:hypothetical protein
MSDEQNRIQMLTRIGHLIPLEFYQHDKVTVEEAVDVNARPLKMGEKIEDGDFFVVDGKEFPATDTGSGIMSSGHFPHFRPNAEANR